MPPRKRSASSSVSSADYRHDDTRLNNPPAGLADMNPVPPGRKRYEYDPRLDPQLVWAGKKEHLSFDVETVPLHIHERVSPAAIVESLRTGPVQRSLFADPEFDLNQAVEFYTHEMEWANRMILGDSLLVMNSLLEREVMAGKVQCIYFDPPYGIKYGSNFQPFVNKRDVKDGDDASLTREPEQIRAFRDTWELGIHSYLTYLRDRLLLMRDILAESGSIFIQISDENVHRVRALMDEIFGLSNFCGQITFVKNSGATDELLPALCDYLLWYSKNKERVKYRQLYYEKTLGSEYAERYEDVELPSGVRRRLTREEQVDPSVVPANARIYTLQYPVSQGYRANTSVPFEYNGVTYDIGKQRNWKTTIEGMNRLGKAGRLVGAEKMVYYVRYLDDFPAYAISNLWSDTQDRLPKRYVIETVPRVIQRCILMTTDPGDLVFDPTCGSGTTAFVAEQWGRRWITCDTSRVALALARQRLMTATFPFYKLAYPAQGIRGSFIYKKVPHVMLQTIANTPEIDEIYNRWQAKTEPIRKQINQLLKRTWLEWQLPRDHQDSWPLEAKQLLGEWWDLCLRRQREINALIERVSAGETLYDRPEIEDAIVRVSGPFTVEAVQPPILDPDAVDTAAPADDAGGYLDRMIEQLRRGGLTVRGQHLPIQRIAPLVGGVLHAEADYEQGGKTVRAAVIFGPQYGPLTSSQLQDALNEARGTYDALIAAAFTFDAPAHALLQKATLKPPVIGVSINADLLMGNLLKTSKSSQVFSVFGKPDVTLSPPNPDGYTVTVRGVDVYDPNTGDFEASSAEQVAAWFLDTDYDGAAFLVRQAYFPTQTPNPWEKISKALKGSIDPEQFEALQRTISLPFKAGKHKQCAVKVIDMRGNEVMTVLRLQ